MTEQQGTSDQPDQPEVTGDVAERIGEREDFAEAARAQADEPPAPLSDDATAKPGDVAEETS